MNFLGMGTMEVLVVLLVAFIFLGPARMIDTGKSLGRAIRQLRRMSADLSESWLDEEDFSLTERPKVHRRGGRGTPSNAGDTDRPANKEGGAEPGGPVAYRPATAEPEEASPTSESERPGT